MIILIITQTSINNYIIINYRLVIKKTGIFSVQKMFYYKFIRFIIGNRCKCCLESIVERVCAVFDVFFFMAFTLSSFDFSKLFFVSFVLFVGCRISIRREPVSGSCVMTTQTCPLTRDSPRSTID